MYTLFIILIVIAAILVTLLVLIQNSKGGGLASGFASGNQVMGAPKTANFLEKATWVLIVFIALLSIVAVRINNSNQTVTGSKISGGVETIQNEATGFVEGDAAEATTPQAE